MGDILFIGHRIPFPPDRGDKIRSHHVLKRLAQLGRVHVATFADDEADAAEESALAGLVASYCLVRRSKPVVLSGLAALASGKPVSLTAFRDARLARYIAETIRRHAIERIYVFSGQMGQYIPPDFAGRVVFDFVDVDSAKFEAYAAQGRGPMRWINAREARLLRADEERLATRAGTSLLATEAEAALFRARLSPEVRARVKVSAMGNGIDTVAFDPAVVAPEARVEHPALIFTGQMDYPPNVAAVVRAANRIMPLVRQAVPDASFHIIGRKPPAVVLALDGVNGTRVWGRVDDIRPWLRGADAALVPLEIARGVQNKVLEAMAMALPTVASSGAVTGIAAQAGRDIAVADSDADLAQATVQVLTDKARAKAMGEAARRFVEERHNWDAVLEPLAELMGVGSDGAGNGAGVRDAA